MVSCPFAPHIDIEPMTELRYFDALTELLADKPFWYRNLFLFPQHGLLRSNAVALIKEALTTGKAAFIGWGRSLYIRSRLSAIIKNNL